MNISRYLKIRIENGVATVFAATNEVTLTFRGASCACGALPGTDNLTSFSLYPEKDKGAVFALKVYYNPSGRNNPLEVHGLLLELSWKGGTLVCDLDKQFVPALPTLAHVDSNSSLCVSYFTEGEKAPVRFASNGYPSYDEKLKKQGWRMIADSNLLCGLIVGAVAYEDVLKESSESLFDQLKRENAETAAQNAALEKAAAANAAALKESEQKLAEATHLIFRVADERDSYKRTLGFISRNTASINHLLSMQWNLFSRRTWFGNRISRIKHWMSQIETLNPSMARPPEEN